mmetsp:Transcript_7336/g.12967  ORF Transcript_7336/g.12967 Transcript_7336/m.12967 type:complete len:221 (+) Transcript_7336:545-1207(+)
MPSESIILFIQISEGFTTTVVTIIPIHGAFVCLIELHICIHGLHLSLLKPLDHLLLLLCPLGDHLLLVHYQPVLLHPVHGFRLQVPEAGVVDPMEGADHLHRRIEAGVPADHFHDLLVGPVLLLVPLLLQPDVPRVVVVLVLPHGRPHVVPLFLFSFHPLPDVFLSYQVHFTFGLFLLRLLLDDGVPPLLIRVLPPIRIPWLGNPLMEVHQLAINHHRIV